MSPAEEVERTAEEAEAPPAPASAEDAAKLLPMRLSPFAPPDRLAEARTSERLRQMSFSQLRNRRARIDKRLYELGLSVGEPALEIPSIRGTGLVDIDRIIRKVDSLDRAREVVSMEREADGKKPLFGSVDLSWLTDAFRFREIRSRRVLLVSELGLALCAADLSKLGEYAPHVRKLLEDHVATARRIDELFTEMRLLDDEFARRSAEGLGENDPPKPIDKLLTKALDSADEVGGKAVEHVSEFGVNAAKSAVAGGGQAVWGLAKGAFALGSKAVGKFGNDKDEDPTNADIDVPVPPPMSAREELSIPDLLRQIMRLKNEGIITEEEFAAKKAELLKRL